MLKPCRAWTEFSLRKFRSLLTALLVLAVATAPFPCLADDKNGKSTTLTPPSDKTTPSQAPSTQEEALDLALKSITLSQGEGGIEIWRLKAEWANLRKQDNLIQVDTPRLSYFLEDGKVMYVASDKGDVEQKKQLLRFIDHVRVTLDEKQLTGPLLIYNGEDKSMTMPQGGVFTDPGIEGSARLFVWHIDSKIIEAEGDVLFHISRSEKAPENTPASALPEETLDGPRPLNEKVQTRE